MPHLPDLCTVKVVEEEGRFVPQQSAVAVAPCSRVIWKVMEGDKEISQHPEEEVRFSVSVKFHMFQSEEEAELYYSGK